MPVTHTISALFLTWALTCRSPLNLWGVGLGFLLLTALLSTASPLNGVKPQEQVKYAPLEVGGNEFACFDNTRRIPYSYLNDDYCDCLDGSDEPGTSACSLLGMKFEATFHCANKGFKSRMIYKSWVDDGICDCCDGSDEQFRRYIDCPNRCDELGAIWRVERAKAREVAQKGFELRQEFIRQGQVGVVLLKKNLDKLLEQIPRLQREVIIRKTALSSNPPSTVPIQPEAESENSPVGSHEASTERNTVPITQHILESSPDEDEEEAVDVEENGSAANDDPAKGEEEESRRPLAEDVPAWRVMIQDVIDQFQTLIFNVRQRLPELPKLSVSEVPVGDSASSVEFCSYHIEATAKQLYNDFVDLYNNYIKPPKTEEEGIQRELKDLESQLHEAEKNASSLKKLLGFPFGPQNELFPLTGQCLTKAADRFTYEICFFGEARQKDGANVARLGSYVSFDEKTAEMKFGGGTRCGGGIDRSMTVTLICGIQNEIVEVLEPSRCDYRSTVRTPAVCDEASLATAQRDEL